MKKLATVSISALLFTFAVNAQADELKIGVVDFMQAIEKTEKDGALKKLKTDVEKKQNTLKNQEKKIIAAENEIKEGQSVLSEEKLREKMEEYQKLVLDYRQNTITFEQEIAEKRAKVLGEIQSKMTTISSDIAKERNISIVIERSSAVVYSISSLDITDEVIKRYTASKAKK